MILQPLFKYTDCVDQIVIFLLITGEKLASRVVTMLRTVMKTGLMWWKICKKNLRKNKRRVNQRTADPKCFRKFLTLSPPAFLQCFSFKCLCVYGKVFFFKASTFNSSVPHCSCMWNWILLRFVLLLPKTHV